MSESMREGAEILERDFSKGSIGRHICRQAIPLIIAQLIQLLYNIVDRIYIGHLPGENGMALTGIGLAFPVVSLIAAFTNLFSTGGAPLCSIARGAGKMERAEKIVGNSAVLLFFTSVVIMAVSFIFKKPILFAFGASENTWPYANLYLTYYLMGTVLNMMGTGMNAFITSQGFPGIAMLTTVIGAVLNLILDPLLIFGFGMGIEGAAIATVIAQSVSALWVLRFLTGKKAILTIKRKYFRIDWSMAKEIVSLGLTGFIMSATNCVAQVACNNMLNLYGGDLYIGIMTILNSVREIFGLPISGITSGAQPVLGFNYGARQYDRVKQGIRFMTVTGGIYTAVSWVILMLFPRAFLMLFTSSSQMIHEGVPALHLYFAGFFFMLFQFCGQSTFVALGKAKHAVFFSLFRKVIIVLPLTLWLPHIINPAVNGVYLAEPISNVIGGLACFITMYLTVYRKLG